MSFFLTPNYYLMKKCIFTILGIFSILNCFAQTLIGKYEVKGFQFEVHSDIKVETYDHSSYDVFVVSRMENGVVAQTVTVNKKKKNEYEEISSEFQFIDDVFVFEKLKLTNGEKWYGVDRVFVGNNGKLYKNVDNNFSAQKPDLTTYSAQFPGGKDGLHNWMNDHFEPFEFVEFAKEDESFVKFNVQFKIDENGKIFDIDVTGSEELKSKVIPILEKMPNWFPTSEKGVKKVANQSMPVYLSLDY